MYTRIEKTRGHGHSCKDVHMHAEVHTQQLGNAIEKKNTHIHAHTVHTCTCTRELRDFGGHRYIGIHVYRHKGIGTHQGWFT